jgi:hypothetical protein
LFKTGQKFENFELNSCRNSNSKMSDSTHPIPILGAHLNVEFSFTHDGRARISKKSRFMGNSAGWNTQVCVQMFGHFPMAPSIHPSTSSRSDLDQESHSIYDSNAIRSKR